MTSLIKFATVTNQCLNLRCTVISAEAYRSSVFIFNAYMMPLHDSTVQQIALQKNHTYSKKAHNKNIQGSFILTQKSPSLLKGLLHWIILQIFEKIYGRRHPTPSVCNSPGWCYHVVGNSAIKWHLSSCATLCDHVWIALLGPAVHDLKGSNFLYGSVSYQCYYLWGNKLNPAFQSKLTP